MIYIIHGQEEYFIRKKINSIHKDNNAEIIRYDGMDKAFSLDEMLESCLSYSLFADKRIILVDQPFFLISKTDDAKLDQLYEYIKHPLMEVELVFYTYNNNFNTRLKAYKTVSSNAQVIACNSYDKRNFINYVRQRVSEEKLSMNNNCLMLLNDLCRCNATLLNRNIEILKLYPEKIDEEAIRRLCTADEDIDGFEMINAFTSKDVSKALELERKLLLQNDSIFAVIGLLAGQLRFLYYVSYLEAQGNRKNRIAEITGANEYRIVKALETLESLKRDQILRLLYELSELERTCKVNDSVDDTTRFELFILDLLKKGSYA